MSNIWKVIIEKGNRNHESILCELKTEFPFISRPKIIEDINYFILYWHGNKYSPKEIYNYFSGNNEILPGPSRQIKSRIKILNKQRELNLRSLLKKNLQRQGIL